MYANHVPIINSACRAKPATFARAIMFAALSARSQFITVKDQLAELDAEGSRARCLWAWKRDTYAYLLEHKHAVYDTATAARDAEACIWAITRVPGMGIVKAGFVAQMIGHDVACLDVRNIKREGLCHRAYRSEISSRKDKPAYRAKIARYVAETGGRAQELWDAWCIDVAATYGLTPEECSAEHLVIVPFKDRKRKPRIAPPVFSAREEIPF